MSLSSLQDGQPIPVVRTVEGFELTNSKEDYVLIVDILGTAVRLSFPDITEEEEQPDVVDLADPDLLPPSQRPSVAIFENPGPDTFRNLICTSEKQANCISSISVESEKIEVGYVDKDSALVRLSLSKITDAPTSNTSDASNLPKCPGDYEKKTWTDCFGTFSPKKNVKYVGEFKKGKPHGQGTHTLADGSVKDGIWEKGCLEDFCFEEF